MEEPSQQPQESEPRLNDIACKAANELDSFLRRQLLPSEFEYPESSIIKIASIIDGNDTPNGNMTPESASRTVMALQRLNQQLWKDPRPISLKTFEAKVAESDTWHKIVELNTDVDVLHYAHFELTKTHQVLQLGDGNAINLFGRIRALLEASNQLPTLLASTRVQIERLLASPEPLDAIALFLGASALSANLQTVTPKPCNIAPVYLAWGRLDAMPSYPKPEPTTKPSIRPHFEAKKEKADNHSDTQMWSRPMSKSEIALILTHGESKRFRKVEKLIDRYGGFQQVSPNQVLMRLDKMDAATRALFEYP